MRLHRITWIVLALLVSVVAPARAQQPENILTRIPGDCLGFIAVPNVGAAGSNLSRFVNDVTMNQMPGSLLDMLKMQLNLGAGFNDLGGFAVMLLDPAVFGLPTESLLDPNAWPGDAPPMALLLPGNQPELIFEGYAPQVEEGFVTFQLGMETAYAKALGGYSVVAPDKRYVEAVVAASTSAAQSLSAPHQALFAANDVVLYIDVKRAAPVLAAAIDQFGQFMQQMAQAPMMQMGAGPGDALRMYAKLLPMVKDIVAQMQSASLALQFGPQALRLDSLITFAPDSVFGKAVAAWGPVSGPMLDRLPNQPYLIAAGGSWEAANEFAALQRDLAAKMFDVLMPPGNGAAMTPEQKARYLTLVEQMNRQLTGMQIYVGPPPPGSGLMAMGFVMTAQNAQNMLAMMPEAMELNSAFSNAMTAGMTGVPSTTMRYMKNAATVEGISIDVIEMDQVYPPGNEMAAQMAQQMMVMIYGEEKVCLRVAPIGTDRIVMTFGGGEAFLAEAIKAAKTGGPLDADVNVAAGMALLPRKPQFVAVFSVPNLLALIKNAATTMAPPQAQVGGFLDMLQIKTTTPITYGVSAKGPGLYQALSVPTPLISDVYQNVMMFMQMMSQPTQTPNGDPVAPDEDF